jgi:hypothetical protein
LSDTVLGAENTAAQKADKMHLSHRAYVLARPAENKQIAKSVISAMKQKEQGDKEE